jgi:glutathione S-transferase
LRRAVLDALLRQPGYFARIFADGAPAWKQRAYALAVPLAAPVVRKGNGITGKAPVEDGLRAANEALDFVAERGSATGCLVGESFSVADLTAASTLATVVRPAASPMSCPQPVSSSFRMLMDRFAAHPGARWVHATYAHHRASTADFDGPSATAKAAL